MTEQEIDAILTEVGGMTEALKEALPSEKASVYQSLGLHLRYEPDRNRVFATADLGRSLVVSEGGLAHLPHGRT